MILSIDQAAQTGWAIIDDNENIVDFGIIRPKKIKDYDAKISFIKNEMIELIKEYKPMLVTVEGVYANRRNLKTHYNLSKLQGVLINYFIDNQILYEIIAPSTWQNYLGFKQRKEEDKKQKSINYVKEEKGIETKNDNIADAICMTIYAVRKIKIVIMKE